ncbi:hypothetical protein Dimus_024691 [Dionaea muscipula]
MWSYDSARNRDLRDRSVVERTMREGLGLGEEVLQPDLPTFSAGVAPFVEVAPIDGVDSDLEASSEGLSLTMVDPMPCALLLSCEETLGSTKGTDALSGGVRSEMMADDFSVTLAVASGSDGAQEGRVVDDEEPRVCATGTGGLSSLRYSVSASSSMNFSGPLDSATEVRGCADGFSVLGSKEVSCSVTKATGVDEAACFGGNGADRETVVQANPTVCTLLPILPIMPSLIVSDVNDANIIDDGVVREEVRVSPTAREALRPQPTDGLWQPPSSPVEPVAKRVEKQKGTHGGDFGTQKQRVAPRPAPPVQPVMTESAHAGLQTPVLGTRTTGVGRTVESVTDY